MPPKIPRNFSSVQSRKKGFSPPIAKRRPGNNLARSRKRRADNEGPDANPAHLGKGSKRNASARMKVQSQGNSDEDEESEEQEEELEESERRNKLADSRSESIQFTQIVAHLKSKYAQSKVSTKKEEGPSKLVARLEELYGEVDVRMGKIDSGEIGGSAKSQAVANTWEAVTENLHTQESSVSKLSDAISSRVGEAFNLQSPLEEYIQHEEALLGALENSSKLFARRPKVIQVSIKHFQKKQQQRLKEEEERAKAALDAKRLIRRSRKFIAAAR